MREPDWITEQVVLAIHDRQLTEHGGAAEQPTRRDCHAMSRRNDYLYRDAIGQSERKIAGETECSCKLIHSR